MTYQISHAWWCHTGKATPDVCDCGMAEVQAVIDSLALQVETGRDTVSNLCRQVVKHDHPHIPLDEA